MGLPLQSKVIVVIGGTAGIGFSAAKAILNAGGQVVVVGRQPEKVAEAQQAFGKAGRALVADATQPETAAMAITTALGLYGRFDGLYHVAGGSGRTLGDGPLHEITDAGWDATLRLNLTSLFYSNRAAVRRFLKQATGGSILNTSSVLGFSPSPFFFSTHAYAASKAAVIGFARSAASHYAGNQIRINVLAPGLVDTPMSQRAMSDPAIMQFIATKQPLDGGRIGRPSDLDAAAVFFLSDESKFVTGQCLAVDGGWTVSEGQNLG